TEHFQELTLICTKFVDNETEKVNKYISGIPDNIYGNVKKTDNKRKAGDSSRNNHGHQQQPFKRQNVAKVYNMRSGEKKRYGHFKRDCPKLKNKDGGNGSAQGWVYVVGNAEKNGNASRDPDSNVVMGTFLLNNRYASILFDTGADKSFISTTNETLIFCGDESNNGRESRLTIISCSKAQEYMVNGYQIFLAQISAKKEEDKSERKQLKDVPIVQDFSEVFPEDLPGLPLA
ncbi:putative reverse transcriptase domain-containing protein, partial [Tanacetum coccineum]